MHELEIEREREIKRRREIERVKQRARESGYNIELSPSLRIMFEL